jgi:predicted nucleic acid-binding Zn ribbon protein
MAFFKRFAAKVNEEDNVVCSTEELDEVLEDRKRRKKKKKTDDDPDTDS